jgi:hypothetical protein
MVGNAQAWLAQGDHVLGEHELDVVGLGSHRDHARWLEVCQGFIMAQPWALGRWLPPCPRKW